MPTGQGSQESCPFSLLKVPTLHLMHFVCPSKDWYSPASHSVHELCLAALLN